MRVVSVNTLLLAHLLLPVSIQSFVVPSPRVARIIAMSSFNSATPTTDDGVPPAADDPEKDKRAGVKLRAKNLVEKIRAANLLPLLFSFALGYRVAVKTVASSTATTAAKVATKAATTTTTTGAVKSTVVSRAREWPLVSAVLLVVAAREIWRGMPLWLKRNIPWVGRRYYRRRASTTATMEEEQDDPNDLTSLPTIAIKLQSLMDVASAKLTSPLQSGDTQVAFLVLLQLIGQLKERFAERRDERYHESGQELKDFMTEFEGMDEMFEFADWAYDELPDEQPLKEALGDMKFSVVRHDKTALPGCVAHYIAISKERKVALIGVKGTSSLEDLLTDCCGNAVPYELEGPFVRGGNTTIYCHEGILLAAQRLALDVEVLVEELLLPSNYKIVIVGHSLGAGVAALLGVILRSKFPKLRTDYGTELLQVRAFASPPILDYDAALACQSFVTTIVNNSDIIPRASLSNLVVLMELLKILNDKLEEKGKKPKDWKTASEFMRMLSDKDGEMIISIDELREGMDEAFEKVELRDPGHLYVPGRVIHMYDLWSKKDYGKVKEAVAKEDDDDHDLENQEVRTAERVYVGVGTSKMLRDIEMDPRMMADHLSPGYRSSIRSILSSSASQPVAAVPAT